LLIAQVARVSGAARVIATEKLSHRIDAAKHFGAETFPLMCRISAESVI
jgi:threonine dehydrogenase-like Zn-dependent dehydrogenase